MALITSSLKGIGFAGAGNCLCGFGFPAVQIESSRQDLVIDSGPAIGQIGDCRLIDPITKDYKYNDRGYMVGGLGIQQLVYMALITVKGSSAMTTLGQTYSTIKVIGSNIQPQIQSAVQQALQPLINQNKISLLSTTAVKQNNLLSIIIKWQDITTNKTFTTII